MHRLLEKKKKKTIQTLLRYYAPSSVQTKTLKQKRLRDVQYTVIDKNDQPIVQSTLDGHLHLCRDIYFA